MRDFLNDLVGSGRVRIRPQDAAVDDDALRQELAKLDTQARLELPFQPPALDLESAAWAVRLLHAACTMLLLRDIEADVVRKTLSAPSPSPPSPSVCYSVDLALRYLPGLMALARGLADDDPLVEALAKLARAWPLSSVGASDIGTVDVSAFIGNRSLRQLYVDRIIAHDDFTRLDHPDVREGVRAALGEALSPSPAFRGALAQEQVH